MMRGSRQRNTTPGPSLKAQGRGAEAGSLVKRGRGRPRKDASLDFATQQGSAAGEKKQEEGASGVQEGQLLRPSPNDNILSFKCSGCGKFYGTKASLSSHKYICKRKSRKLKLGPKLKRKFPCTLCGKHYGSKQYLKFHLQHSHDQELQNKRKISKRDANDNSDTAQTETDSRAVSARVVKVRPHLHFFMRLLFRCPKSMTSSKSPWVRI